MTEQVRADALLVIDVQERWVADRGSLLGVLRTGLAAAREAGALVVHVHDDTGGDLALAPLPGEPVLAKPGDDGFRGTDLGALLADAGCRSIAVTGLLAEMCVAATARTALERGFGVVWARDAVASDDVPPAASAPGVPAAHVCRVAEWSLGDQLAAADRLGDIAFSGCSTSSNRKMGSSDQGFPPGARTGR